MFTSAILTPKRKAATRVGSTEYPWSASTEQSNQPNGRRAPPVGLIRLLCTGTPWILCGSYSCCCFSFGGENGGRKHRDCCCLGLGWRLFPLCGRTQKARDVVIPAFRHAHFFRPPHRVQLRAGGQSRL